MEEEKKCDFCGEEMTEFNQGWWNCFLSYTDTISFSISACNFARDQMNSAGVSLNELNRVLDGDFIMLDKTKEILTEYKKLLILNTKEEKKCDFCGEEKKDVDLVRNPYTHEMYGDESLYLICDECHHELCMDI